jgi:pantetheine-phosphate adenylyltransferase
MKEKRIIDNQRNDIETIFSAFSIKPISLGFIERCYNERHRYFHDLSHINKLLSNTSDMFVQQEISEDIFIDLFLVILFHDIVYEPWNKIPGDNEKRSAEVFKQYFNIESHKDVYDAIIDTYERKNDTELKRIFNKLDLSILYESEFLELIEYENKIFKEYQFLDIDEYIEHRINFLRSIEIVDDMMGNQINRLIDYITCRNYNIGIFPGSFNDLTVGHYDTILKAEQIFDKVIIVKAVNSTKTTSIEKLYEQFEFLKKQLPDREVKFVEGNIINKLFVDNKRNPTMIRGIRNYVDLNYEDVYLTFCKEYHPELKSILILCDKKYSHVSSSSLRTLEDGDPIREKLTQPIYNINN